MSVKQCQQEIDSAEFAEWMAFSNSQQSLGNDSASPGKNHPNGKPKIQSALAMEKTLEALYGRNK